MAATGRLIRRRDCPWLMCLCGAALLASAPAEADTPHAMDEVAPGLFVRHGAIAEANAGNTDAIANIGFVVGRDSVAVIDPGGSLTDGQKLRAAVRAATAKPISHVILSHVHPDHVFGAAAFLPDRPVFVGHARLPTALAARGAYYRGRLTAILGAEQAGDYVVPTLLVRDATRLDLGGRALDLTAHGPAHTDADLTILDASSFTLWAADLLFIDRVPSLDGSLIGWLAELDRLRAVPARLVVPGHGPSSAPWPDAAAAETRYFHAMAREIRALIARGGDIETASRTVALDERDRWALFDDYNGRNVTEAFHELEWE